jgi:hypothetical protein
MESTSIFLPSCKIHSTYRLVLTQDSPHSFSNPHFHARHSFNRPSLFLLHVRLVHRSFLNLKPETPSVTSFLVLPCSHPPCAIMHRLFIVIGLVLFVSAVQAFRAYDWLDDPSALAGVSHTTITRKAFEHVAYAYQCSQLGSDPKDGRIPIGFLVRPRPFLEGRDPGIPVHGFMDWNPSVHGIRSQLRTLLILTEFNTFS